MMPRFNQGGGAKANTLPVCYHSSPIVLIFIYDFNYKYLCIYSQARLQNIKENRDPETMKWRDSGMFSFVSWFGATLGVVLRGCSQQESGIHSAGF